MCPLANDTPYAGCGSVKALNRIIVDCRRCPRLTDYREQVARDKRAAFRKQEYWGRPVPGFGDPRARVFIVGLAPAAHGGNRTGRVFTGDRSGDFLYAALYRAGFANQPTSISRDDGLRLTDVYVAAAARCAPPDNKPTHEELDLCRPYLIRELQLLEHAQVIVALGQIAFDAALRTLAGAGQVLSTPKPKFAHGATFATGPYALLSCYHPSQRNTSTGLVTPGMYDRLLEQVQRLLRPD